MTDWHGWKRTDRKWTLHIGHLPDRRQPALYVESETEGRVLAYFRDDAAAREAMEYLDDLIPVPKEVQP